MLKLAKQLTTSRPLLSYHHYLVSSYKTQYYNVVFTLVADVILVELHHEMLKHKPTKRRHVDIPPDSDHLRLDWLMLLTFFLRVSFVPKLIVIDAFLTCFLIWYFPFV